MPSPSFLTDIVPLFSTYERGCMMSQLIPTPPGPFDLHNLEHVRVRADRILIEVAAGLMPQSKEDGTKPGVPWDIDKVRRFALWIDGGMLP